MTCRVIATKGCGSAIVEATLALAHIPYVREEVNYETEQARIREWNPLGQVPALILPDGHVMTESAAIALYVDETAPDAHLLPPAGGPLRRETLRWLVFLVAAVYPTFTYGDDPAKWVGAAGADALRASTDAHREKLWRQLEGVAGAPWFLGDVRSVLDVYVCVMTHWRPRRAWFAAECPKLAAIAAAVDRDPALAHVWATNFAAPAAG